MRQTKEIFVASKMFLMLIYCIIIINKGNKFCTKSSFFHQLWSFGLCEPKQVLLLLGSHFYLPAPQLP